MIGWVMTASRTAEPRVQEALTAPPLPAAAFTWHDTRRPGHTHPQRGPSEQLISGQLAGAPLLELHDAGSGLPRAGESGIRE